MGSVVLSRPRAEAAASLRGVFLAPIVFSLGFVVVNGFSFMFVLIQVLNFLNLFCICSASCFNAYGIRGNRLWLSGYDSVRAINCFMHLKNG